TQLRLNNDNQTRVAERRDSLTALLAEAASSPQVFGAPSTAPSGAQSAAPSGAPSAGEPGAVRLAQLRQELGRTLARYTQQHPTGVRLKAEIAGTEREVAEIEGTERKPTAGKPIGTERELSEPGVRVGVGPSWSPYILRLRETLSAADSEAKVLKAE